MSQPPRAPNGADRDLADALALVDRLQSALQRQARAETVEVIRQLVAVRAPMSGQWHAIAQIAAQYGEASLAREAVDLFVESARGSSDAIYRKVGVLVQIGALADALALLCTLPPNVPDPASHALTRGGIALALGAVDDARQWLVRSTLLRPQSGATWHTLSRLVDFADEPELADRLVAGESGMGNAPAPERALYYYALGKAHADRNEPARSFAAVSRAAQEMKSAAPPYDRRQDHSSASEAVTGFDAAGIAAVAERQSEPTERTLFVTGLPRSGTTLVEQILTSHSAVADGAELNRFALLAQEIAGLSYPALRRYVDEAGAPSAARLWHHWLDERFPAPGRVVDKTPDASRTLGLVAALLPQAPLIWLTRDPLDCAWSCFRTGFLGSMPWSHDLTDIAFHFQLEDKLLSQWQEILGNRLLVVPYEALVTDPRHWIARILAHCDLPEEAQAFAPHENARPVTTSSVMQVRRPISRSAIGAAEPYREFLEPFVDAYFGVGAGP